MSRYYEESEIMKALDSNLIGTYDGLVLNVDMDEFLDGVPTADVVEVVRCKDCKYADFDQYDKTEEFDVFCFHFSMGFMRRCDFCSWGERRENGEIH